MNDTTQFVPDANNVALRAVGLGKVYGSERALSDISLDVRRGEILGVIGPSGGGKSTLLRALAALETLNSGYVEYHTPLQMLHCAPSHPDHARRTRPNQIHRSVGIVFQNLNLWDHWTVEQNLLLAPLTVLGEDRALAQRRARDFCSQFSLDGILAKRAWTLSGGQRQRVAIIRALMMDPRILLLDEITSALDPSLTYDVMQVIRGLRDSGLTMIVVTHHIEFASRLCDRLAFISRGAIIQCGPPADLSSKPATDEVRRFLQVLAETR